MLRARTSVIIGVITTAVSGCIGVPLKESTMMEEEVPRKETALVIGETERIQVREVLGEPMIASDFWRFDVFRLSDDHYGLGLFFIYLPVPLWEKIEAYILVSYDENGRVADYGSGHRARGPISAIEEGESDEVMFNVGDLQLWTSDDELYIAADSKRRDEYLDGMVAEGTCRLLVDCKSCDIPIRVNVSVRLPMSDSETLRRATPLESRDMRPSSISVVKLDAGSYRVDFEPLADGRPLLASGQFDCISGATHYALLQVGDTGERVASVEITSEKPLDRQVQPILIYKNGRWLVDAEPVDRMAD